MINFSIKKVSADKPSMRVEHRIHRRTKMFRNGRYCIDYVSRPLLFAERERIHKRIRQLEFDFSFKGMRYTISARNYK